MLASDYTICALATMVWNRAGKDSFLGMTAQALLVRNRVLAGWEGTNWNSLIQNHEKYSGTPNNTPIVWGDPTRDDSFRRALAIANNVYEGRELDITMGALRGCILSECSEDFANKIVRPTRTLDNGAVEPLHARVATVGRWSFFR